jgi:hypothetical protein
MHPAEMIRTPARSVWRQVVDFQRERRERVVLLCADMLAPMLGRLEVS